MNHRITAFAVIFAVVGLLSSCLKSDNDSQTYSEDTMITSFSLGTVKGVRHTLTADGRDSSYVYTYSAAAFPFEIDQKNDSIYNLDSLAVGTDVRRALATVLTRNNGVVFIKKLGGEDSWSYLNSTDSTDFSQTRTLRVTSQDGQYHRDYRVQVNVHREYADSFAWKAEKSYTTEYLAGGVNAAILRGKIYCYGADTVVCATDSALFMMHNGDFNTSVDGETWTPVTPAGSFAKLIAAEDSTLLGISDKGLLIKSVDGGLTWVDEVIEDTTYNKVYRNLPVKDVNILYVGSKTNSDITRTIMVGNDNYLVSKNDTAATVWCKVDDTHYPEMSQPWTLTQYAWYNHLNVLPNMKGLSVVNYYGTLYAIGGESDNKKIKYTPYKTIFSSPDCGVTWHVEDRFALPNGYTTEGVTSVKLITITDGDRKELVFVAARTIDEGGVQKTKVEIWRGRQNKQAWNNGDTQFK